MINLFTAIKDRLDSSNGAALRALIGTRMTQGTAPVGTKHPLIEIVASAGGDTAETINCDEPLGSRIETANLDFICQSVKPSPLEAWQVAAEVKSLYDGQILSLGATQNMVDVKRGNPGVQVEDYDDDSFNIIISYTYMYG